jgi:DNA mismatch endonuclease, patch repair protein
MSDRLTPEQRSSLMSRIRGKNTGTELTVFRLLRREGVYFGRHRKDLPGSPDVVLQHCRLAVFIDGDFWHGHYFNAWKDRVSTFWVVKIEANIRRDRKNRRRLRESGWTVLRLWSKDIDRDPHRAVMKILNKRNELLNLNKEGD